MTTSDSGFVLTKETPFLVAGYAFQYVEVVVQNKGRPSEHGVHITDYIKSRERSPKRAAALARARQRLASKISDAPQFSLTALRLSRGLSQTKLAEKIDNHQSFIARIEKGEADVLFSTIEKLAGALGVSVGVTSEAVLATRTAASSSSNRSIK